MPNLSDTPNRNTLNQRASRARKQEYIASLESKVREYETRGIQATSEVQNAARQVAEENRMLKDELTVLREHVRCLESVLNKQGVVGVVVDDDDDDEDDEVERVDGEGNPMGKAGRVRSHKDKLIKMEWWRGDTRDKDMSIDRGMRLKTVRRRSIQLREDGPAETMAHEDHHGTESPSNQYSSPTDDRDYSENGYKRRRTSPSTTATTTTGSRIVASPFDEQDAASILLSTATTPVTYEEGTTNPLYKSNYIHHPYQHHNTPASSETARYESWRQSTIPQSHPHPQTYTQAHGSSTLLPNEQLASRPAPEQPPRRISDGNSTPCEEAALIIASMRGLAPLDQHQSEILQKLGCGSRDRLDSCKVDNVRLFGIMAGERT